MSAEIIVTPNGLQTNPSQILAGGGGLSECTNAICRRPGMVEPRGGFSYTGSSTFATNNYTTTTHVADYASNRWLVVSDAASGSVITKNVDWANRLTLSQANLTPRSAPIGQSQAFVLDGGIRMLDAVANPSTGLTRFCGIQRPVGPLGVIAASGTAALNWLATGYVTAYRVVFRRVINGRDYVSPPTERCSVYNGSGSAAYVSFSVPVPSYSTGWYADIYRSPTQTAYGTPPSDEMRLIDSHLVTSADAALGWFAFTDQISDGTWSGATIYTAGTQNGIAKSYYAPGVANDVATYNGMTFLAGHRPGYRATVQLKAMGDGNDPARRLVSVKCAATTNSTTAVTGLTAAALSYLAVGQIVTLSSNTSPGSADATFPALCKIVSINTGASSLVLDQAATTTGAVTIVAWDWIKVTGTNQSRYVYAGWVDKVGATTFDLATYTDTTPRSKGVFAVADDGTTRGIIAGGAGIERAFGSLSPITSSSVEIRCWAVDDATQPRLGTQLTFAEIAAYDTGGATTLGTNTFTVTSTKPYAFDLSLDSVTGITSTLEGGTNVVAWSELDKPESFPLPNFAQLGSANNVVDRIAVAGDSLFAFTREGLYRIYGVTPDGLSVGVWDSTARTTSGSVGWVTRHGDAVYAWVQRGIVRVDASGVQNIDGPIRDISRSYGPSTLNSSLAGTFAGADEPNGLVMFGAAIGGFGTAFCYVYAVEAGTWCYFDPYICGSGGGYIGAATRGVDGTLYVGTHSSAGFAYYFEVPVYDTDGNSAPYRYDVFNASGTYTNPSISAGSDGRNWVATTGASVIPIEIGDVVRFSNGTDLYVTAVDGLGGFTVSAVGGATGAVQLVFKAYTCSVTYVGSTEGVPLLEKKYTEETLSFGVMRYGRTYTLETRRWGDDLLNGSTSQTVLYDSAGTTYGATEIRSMTTRRAVPIAQGRGVALATRFSIKQARNYFALLALSIQYEPVTPKINRGQS